jgi:tetratricopeptide (TPR) repeat protein
LYVTSGRFLKDKMCWGRVFGIQVVRHHIGILTNNCYLYDMKPSNELFELIKSLTKSEKRFFKLQSSLQSGDKNYIRLFDTIDKMTEYDEEEVKSVFKGEKFIKHLPSEKNHLYKVILKALRSFYGETSISSMLKQEIKNIEILYNKALFGECNKFLERAKKLAIRYEKFYYLYELINWEKTLLEEAYEDGQFKDLNILIEEEREVLDKLRNLAEYHVLYSKINYVFRSGGYARTEENKVIVDDIVNHPLIKGKNTALSRRAATICYYTQGFCNMANGDYHTALEKFQRVIVILDENHDLRTDLAKRYVRTLSNIVTCHLDTHHIDEAKRMIDLIQTFKDSDGFTFPDVQAAIFKNSNLAKLEVYHQTGGFGKALKEVDEMIANMAEFEGKISKESQLTFYYQIAFIHFGVHQHNKALFWLNKVLNDNEKDLRQDIFSYARLFNLVIHYELGNHDLLEYTIKSTARYLQKRERDFPIEKQIMDQMKKLIRTQSVSEKAKIFEGFKVGLKKLLRGPEDLIVLKYFDFNIWIESKLKNTSYEEELLRLHK